jgi:hypothetical protein
MISESWYNPIAFHYVRLAGQKSGFATCESRESEPLRGRDQE